MEGAVAGTQAAGRPPPAAGAADGVEDGVGVGETEADVDAVGDGEEVVLPAAGCEDAVAVTFGTGAAAAKGLGERARGAAAPSAFVVVVVPRSAEAEAAVGAAVESAGWRPSEAAAKPSPAQATQAAVARRPVRRRRAGAGILERCAVGVRWNTK
jgi:hypothetical protein